jgi:glutamate racemase
MKIGIFDSGLGGLLLTRAIVDRLPEYDFVYLGDTQRVPYGNRSHDVVYKFLLEAIEYLFKNDCSLIIVACNTASALGVAQIQQEYLPIHHPDKKVLGVIVPTAEKAVEDNPKKLGVLATIGTVEPETFVEYIHKFNSNIEVMQQPAPLLVPLIENGADEFIEPILKSYLESLLNAGVDTLILGCTHYPYVKNLIRSIVGENIRVLSQDEIVPDKLADYLQRHQEIDEKLSRGGKCELLVTDITKTMSDLSKTWFGDEVELTQISY